MSRLIFVLIVFLTSCWIRPDDTELLIPEVSYFDDSDVIIDTLVVKSIYLERGMVTVNNKVRFLDGFLKLVGSGKTYPSFFRSVKRNDTIYIDMTVNKIYIKNLEKELTYRKKLESDYEWWDHWW